MHVLLIWWPRGIYIGYRCSCLRGGPINEEEVRKHISKMKSNKAPGWDGITAEHIKHGGHILDHVLTWVLNTIAVSEKIPSHFKKGLIVSIPKGSKDASIKTNNRGITLLPVLYKLLENIMLDREKDYFGNVMNELQGAAQLKCSCLHTSMVLQEAIAYHTNKGANVYVAFLDIQKAFDTVWIPGMLYKLFITGLNEKSWRLVKKRVRRF